MLICLFFVHASFYVCGCLFVFIHVWVCACIFYILCSYHFKSYYKHISQIECDRTYTFPRASLDAMGDLGLLGLIIPKDLGGMGESHACGAMVVETLARYGCPATAMIYSNAQALLFLLSKFAWLPKASVTYVYLLSFYLFFRQLLCVCCTYDYSYSSDDIITYSLHKMKPDNNTYSHTV